MGAVPRVRLLNDAGRSNRRGTERPLFDADAIRAIGRRTAFVRRVERPTLVLGSTQDVSIVDGAAMARHGVELATRRSGGGAVFVEPGRAVWIDTWVPRADPLWSEDVVRAKSWVGSWWAAALGARDLDVHEGRPIESRWSAAICFAGVAAGEVVHRGRKAVGVAQWRSREGALTHSLAYLGIDWAKMTELLDLGPGRTEAADQLTASTTTLADLGATDPARLAATLIDRLPDAGSWEVRSEED